MGPIMKGTAKKTSGDLAIYSKIGRSVVEILITEGLIKERVIRDITIRENYKQLVESGKRSKEARKLLSEVIYVAQNGDKYLLGKKNIEKIIYSKEI
jgi:hypothetical protein